MAGALGVFARPEAEVESQCDQAGNLAGFRVGGDGRSGHYGVDNDEGDGIFLFNRRILDALRF